jgi:hypothetical protein
MAEELGSPTPPTSDGGGRNTTLIIIVVVVLVLLCCCCLSLALAWNFGDAFIEFLDFNVSRYFGLLYPV